jgi:rhodanese-related sulfurtransferase
MIGAHRVTAAAVVAAGPQREEAAMRRTLRVDSGLLILLAAGLALAATTMLIASGVSRAQVGNIYQATLEEPNQTTGEIGTDELQRILVDGSAIVIDSRKRSEYMTSHIPGALNAATEPGTPPEAVVSDIERLAGGDKTAAVVLYCNGPFCQASRRLGEQLVAAGFTNVRRYQIGLPVWRALGGTTEMELEALRRVYALDKTAVFLDARSAQEFMSGTLPGARNIPPESLDRGVLRPGARDVIPDDDFNTRIVVFGADPVQARALAEAVTRAARDNVAYFPGTFEDLISGVNVTASVSPE